MTCSHGIFCFLVLLSCAFFSCSPDNHSDIEAVPKWAKTVIWYQIFPERFNNGDPGNDPQLEDIKNSWPHDMESPYGIASWTSDWYAKQPWESDEHDFYYNVQRRRYGGDLKGVIDKLDYLQGLGVTALYFNPLFESPSLHKYDGATYHHIDDNFGPDPDRDRGLIVTEVPDDPKTWQWTTADSLFLELISHCHRRGMRLIIDGVFNHVGLNFWAFRDVVEKQQDSKYASWFTIKKWDDPDTAENEFDYAGWFGVRELPEILEDEHGPAPSMKAYIFHSVQRWMDPNGDGDPSDGIDGWRLDVADMVAEDFWRDFRKHVRSINPDAYIVGEVWWEDWNDNNMFNAAPWLEGDLFDAVMNYRWAGEVIHFFVDKQKRISAGEFAGRLDKLRADYRADVNYVLMNLLDSHDTDRIASQIVNPDDDYDHRDNPRDNPDYSIRKPNERELKIQKLIALFQMTYIGAPTIYYGDEAGMWGGDDPDCRKPMSWPERAFSSEKSHPMGGDRPIDNVFFDHDLFDHYRKMIAIRNAHPALQTGDYGVVLIDDEADVFAFKRFNAEESLIIVINNADVENHIRLTNELIEGTQDWFELIEQKPIVSDGKELSLSVPAKSGRILSRSNG